MGNLHNLGEAQSTHPMPFLMHDTSTTNAIIRIAIFHCTLRGSQSNCISAGWQDGALGRWVENVENPGAHVSDS